ncbi:hypothetical protein [Vibrio splendidus]|uniref:hypothetical protein n=1 Tax=Vibrio splendidus TaxID=29497 RepID=UPI003D0D45FF
MFDKTRTQVDNDLISIKQGGVGNKTEINKNITFNINSPLTNPEISKALLEQLASATSTDKYITFICAPCDDDSTDRSKEIFVMLTSELHKKNIEFVVGGGKELIENDGPYPHLNESNMLKDEKCNAIIVIADDHSTFSQLSLLSQVKFNSNLSSLEMYAICQDNVIDRQTFIRTGPVKFFKERTKGLLVNFSECDDKKIEDLVESISTHKVFWKSQRRS